MLFLGYLTLSRLNDNDWTIPLNNTFEQIQQNYPVKSPTVSILPVSWNNISL